MKFLAFTLVLSTLLLTACGKETTPSGSDAEASRLALSSTSGDGLISSLVNNKDAAAKWNAIYPSGNRGAVSANQNNGMLYHANQAMKAAKIASEQAPKKPTSTRTTRSLIGGTLTLTVPPLLNTYFPSYAKADMFGAVIGGVSGVVYASYLNDPSNGGYHLYLGIPFVYPYPTGLPFAAFVGEVFASGNGLPSSAAIAAAYVDAYGAYWGFSSPSAGTKACYLATGYPYPYCWALPPTTP